VSLEREGRWARRGKREREKRTRERREWGKRHGRGREGPRGRDGCRGSLGASYLLLQLISLYNHTFYYYIFLAGLYILLLLSIIELVYFLLL